MNETVRTALNFLPLLAFEACLLFVYRKAPLSSFVTVQSFLGVTAGFAVLFDGVAGLPAAAGVLGVLATVTGGRFAADARRAPDPPPQLPLAPQSPKVEQNVQLLHQWLDERSSGGPARFGGGFRSSVAVAFRLPPEQIFPLVGDIDRWDEWPGRSSSAARLDDAPWGEGARYRVDVSHRSTVHQSICVVTRFAPMNIFGCASVGAQPLVTEVTSELSPSPEGGSILSVETSVYVRARATRILMAPLWPLQSALFRYQLRGQLLRFRAWAEAAAGSASGAPRGHNVIK